MKIVIDVNIILSALIKNSATREIVMESGLDFCFPEPSLAKINKYLGYVIEKSGLSKDEYDIVLTNLLKHVDIVTVEEILRNWTEAKKIMEHIDAEDVVFIATAMCFENTVIWSDDKHFEKQNRIKVWKTSDLIRLL